MQQSTIERIASLSGFGLHTGARVAMTVRPANANTGVVFRRVDLGATSIVRAHVDHVVDTRMATTLKQGDAQVSTVEHFLAAVVGLGIDNLVIDLDAGELPIMDGSAAPFVHLLQDAGLTHLPAVRSYVRVLRQIEVSQGDAYVRLSPCDAFTVSYALLYDHPAFRRQPSFSQVEVTPDRFVSEVCRARTFGFMADFERLRSMDLARGGSLDNAIVVDDFRILNVEGLRQSDEFVMHKVLDAIGDMALIGKPLLARFEGHKSGHDLNSRVLRALLADRDAFEIVEALPRSSAKELSPRAAAQDPFQAA